MSLQLAIPTGTVSSIVSSYTSRLISKPAKTPSPLIGCCCSVALSTRVRSSPWWRRWHRGVSFTVEGKEEAPGALFVGEVPVDRLPRGAARPRVDAREGDAGARVCERGAFAMWVSKVAVIQRYDGESEGVAESANGDGG